MDGGEDRVRRDGPTTGADAEATAAAKAGEAARGAAARGSELGRSAAAKGSELGRTAALKGSELGRTAATKGTELRRSAATKRTELTRTMRKLDVPWARCRPARMLRETILQFGLGPLIDTYTKARVYGRDRFNELPAPVVLVANHSSHLDTPTILRALPLKWRQRTAVAAAADYFYKKRAVANFVALVFNTVPLMRRGGGLKNGSTDHVDRLLDQRWNLLMFPEGTRSRDGRLGRLRSGAAVIAREHGIPIVPVRVKGTHDAMPPGQNWPRRVRGRLLSHRHPVEIHFGAPIWPADDQECGEVMDHVRRFLEDDADARRRNGDGDRFARGLAAGELTADVFHARDERSRVRPSA
jgi:1-acyl-sn-glycerol-3-phosphate acyltransferase